MTAFAQLATGQGSTVDGIMFDHYGYQSTFSLSATLLLAASLSVLIPRSLDSGKR
ncbi:hypothetical protein [Marinobacterium rhizophilum]|uniref:hypothetical protein n=1 Tax=Marinobacterium rhizophilum TaxID=420402 RepID=UPI00037A8D66|nr:hypothetical protein [Marinobacterium rhizophilum]